MFIVIKLSVTLRLINALFLDNGVQWHKEISYIWL